MDRLISLQAAIDAVQHAFDRETLLNSFVRKVAVDALKTMPSAQQETISEDYAKAVRNWLVHYQVKCAELRGRYTPYEVLGWVVSDWRKENEIW